MEEIYKSEKNKVKMILIESMLLFSLFNSRQLFSRLYTIRWNVAIDELFTFNEKLLFSFNQNIDSELNFNCLLLFNIEFARLRDAFSSTKKHKSEQISQKIFLFLLLAFLSLFSGGNLFNQSYS